MTAEERGLGARWFEEVWNKGRREAVEEMLSPDAVLHEGDRDSVGPASFYEFYDRLNAAFSESHVTVDDILVEDDRACLRWTCTCKHTGDALGIAATQKHIRVTGITILRLANGRFVEAWQNWDMLGMLEQIRGASRAATYVNAS